MKQTFLLAFAFLLTMAVSGQSQLQKGTHFAGIQTTLVAGDIYNTSLRFSTGSSQTEYAISLTPTYGYALARNWLLGATITLGYSREKTSYVSNQTIFNYYDLGFAPFTRLYLDLGKNGSFKAFGVGSLEFATLKSREDYSGSIIRTSNTDVTAAIGVGLGYFGRKTAVDINISGVGIRLGVYKTFGPSKK